ncbi:hypothetical protein KK120_18600 [Virgibacillus dakarensis]|nr:hypothetical protein [Virgibacillus dakarensis]
MHEIVDLILKDIKEQAKQQLINIQIASVPLLMITENGSKELQKQSNELLKIAGIETKKEDKKGDDLEEIKNLLQSFKN